MPPKVFVAMTRSVGANFFSCPSLINKALLPHIELLPECAFLAFLSIHQDGRLIFVLLHNLAPKNVCSIMCQTVCLLLGESVSLPPSPCPSKKHPLHPGSKIFLLKRTHRPSLLQLFHACPQLPLKLPVGLPPPLLFRFSSLKKHLKKRKPMIAWKRCSRCSLSVRFLIGDLKNQGGRLGRANTYLLHHKVLRGWPPPISPPSFPRLGPSPRQDPTQHFGQGCNPSHPPPQKPVAAGGRRSSTAGGRIASAPPPQLPPSPGQVVPGSLPPPPARAPNRWPCLKWLPAGASDGRRPARVTARFAAAARSCPHLVVLKVASSSGRCCRRGPSRSPARPRGKPEAPPPRPSCSFPAPEPTMCVIPPSQAALLPRRCQGDQPGRPLRWLVVRFPAVIQSPS